MSRRRLKGAGSRSGQSSGWSSAVERREADLFFADLAGPAAHRLVESVRGETPSAEHREAPSLDRPSGTEARLAGPAARPGMIGPVHRARSTRRGIRVAEQPPLDWTEGDNADRSSILGEAFGSDHVRISLRNDDGTPTAGIAFRARFRDGHIVNGTLDARGQATIANHTHGDVQVTFPGLPAASWQISSFGASEANHQPVLHRRSRRQPDPDRAALRAPRLARDLQSSLERRVPAQEAESRPHPPGRHPLHSGSERGHRHPFIRFIRRVVAAATIDIIEDTDNNHVVGATERPCPLVRIGLWDRAFNGGNVRNGAAEASNFVGRDSRRFYFRVRDPGAAGNTATIEWRTLLANGSDDDAPANAGVTLRETAAGSHVFVSKAVMLVTNDLDAGQATNSGLTAPHPDAGNRNRGQSNHRLRRAPSTGWFRRCTGRAVPPRRSA